MLNTVLPELETKNIEGIETFFCKNSNTWLTVKGCKARQASLKKPHPLFAIETELSVKCQNCKIGNKIKELF